MPGLFERQTLNREVTGLVGPQQAPPVDTGQGGVPGLGVQGVPQPPSPELQTQNIEIQGPNRGINLVADFLTGFGGGAGAAQGQQAQRSAQTERLFGAQERPINLQTQLLQQQQQQQLSQKRFGLQQQTLQLAQQREERVAEDNDINQLLNSLAIDVDRNTGEVTLTDKMAVLQGLPGAVRILRKKKDVDFNIAQLLPANATKEDINTVSIAFKFGGDKQGLRELLKVRKDISGRPGILQSRRRQLAQAERGLRADYLKEAGSFIKIRDQFDRVQLASQDPTGASDLSMIFAFMKMLDPTSVVRESEFRAAASIGSIPQRIEGFRKKITTGEFLSAGQRANFLAEAVKLFGRSKSRKEAIDNRFRKIAIGQGIDPENVIQSFGFETQGITQPQGKPTHRFNPETGKVESIQ